MPDRPALAEPLLWDVQQTATALSLSAPHIRRLVAEKRIPFVRVGRLIRFRPEEIRTWLAGKQIEAVK